jgi:hypothetical protein
LNVEAPARFHAERSTGNVLPASLLKKKGADPNVSRPEVGQAVTPEETTLHNSLHDLSDFVTENGKSRFHSKDCKRKKKRPLEKSRLHGIVRAN